jgi:hypothetical protein
VAGANTNLNAVTALSASDAWAVGTAYASPTTTTSILHWNGSHWTLVPSPNTGTVANGLNGVAALGANDVWAVGDQTSDPTNSNVQQLVEHWDGHAWSVVAGASLGGYSTLAAITRIPGTSQLLAVGAVANPTTAPYHTVIERWNGNGWARMPSPNVGSNSNQLFALTARSGSDAWAVGNYWGPSNGQDGATPQTLIEHFNGSAWKVIASPNVINAGMLVENHLFGVAALSASAVYTVGTYWNPSGDYSYTLAERWNGSRWSLALPYPVYTPPPDYALNGVTSIPGTSQVWAVGSENSNGPDQPVIVARC